jgi:hypothetical protein
LVVIVLMLDCPVEGLNVFGAYDRQGAIQEGGGVPYDNKRRLLIWPQPDTAYSIINPTLAHLRADSN